MSIKPMTLKYLTAVFGSILSAAAWSGDVRPDNQTSEIQFGSVAMNVPAEMHQRLKPLTQYLSTELGRVVTLKLAPDMPTAVKDVASGEVDIAYLTPVAYIDANSKGKTQLVVKTLTGDKASFKLAIAVKATSDIKTVADLAGKRFAFGDKAALLQRAVVIGAGMPLEKLGDHQFIGHYENIARGVMNGDFDAGILKDTVASEWEKKGLRVIHYSPDLPPYNIVVSHDVSEETRKKIEQAFLKLSIDNPTHAQIIRALDVSYTGFSTTSDAEYDVVRRLIKPFEKGS